jgi:two-component system LytT family response regulator
MKRWLTVVAEDEPLAAEGLADWVRQLPQLEFAAACADGASALQRIRELRPDLVLMDIQMPGLTGLQVLKALAEDDAPLPAVIFTTAYDEHALTAFELHAVDYLLKPFTQERFNEAVEHAVQRAGALAQALPALEAASRGESAEPLARVLVRDRAGIVPVQVQDIEYLKSDTKYTAIVSKGRNYLVRLPITAFEQRLDAQRFLKVNRSCLVNLDFVESMTPDASSQYVIKLRDGTSVIASREVSRHLRSMVL